MILSLVTCIINMEFANEVTAAFTMSAFTNDCSRTLKLMGTKGEIRAAMEKNEIEVIDFETGTAKQISLETPGGHIGHGGGDFGLIRDFVKLVQQGGQGIGLTSAAHSVQSHLMAFAAERSRVDRMVVNMREFKQD